MRLFNSKALFICILLSIYPIYSQSDKSSIDLNTAPETSTIATSTVSLIDSVINFSKKYLGSPYRGGGKGPNSFDCSGFTSFVFNNFGIKLGSSSGDQAEQLPTISKNDIQPGDLVFYNGRRRGSRVGHVGLVISKHENGEFDFIHSASSVGISVSNSESDYYNRRYVKAGRVFAFDSLIARTNTSNSDYQPHNSNNNSNSYNSENDTPNQQRTQTVTVQKTIPAKYHTVKSGETLSSIANKYGLTVTQLKKKNHLKKDFLSLKQRLKIKDEQEIAVVEKRKPIIENTVKADSTQANNVITEINSPEMQSAYHTVKKGETLFSISKMYSVKTKDIISLNNLKNESIISGQRLKINKIENASMAQEDKQTNNQPIENNKPEQKEVTLVNENNYGTHIVSRGETLQSISKQYGITIASLKELNNLTTNNILAGQKLTTPFEGSSLKKTAIAKQKAKTHTVKSGETLSEIAEKYHCTVRELKTWNNKSNNKLSLGEKLKIKI